MKLRTGMLLVAALTLPAGAALAQNVTTRLDGEWNCTTNENANELTVFAEETNIGAFGECTAGTSRIEWEANSPNKNQADQKKVSSDQKSFLTVTFFDSKTDESGTALVEKCKGKGEYKASKSEGKASVSCNLDQSLGTTPQLSNTAIANLLTDFTKKNASGCELTEKGKLKIKHKKSNCAAVTVQ